MKIAVLGGSFNPVHSGHFALADEVCVALGYDKVIFVPACKPPHKEVANSIPDQDRINMLKLACATDSRFECDTIEIDRGGISYTWDTVCALEKKYGSVLTDKIGLIMGQDLFEGFHLWHNARALAEKCTLILAVRPKENVSSSKVINKGVGEYAKLKNDGTFSIDEEPLFVNAIRLDNPPMALSSSQVRQRAMENKSFRYLVPSPVFEYIVKGNIYGNFS